MMNFTNFCRDVGEGAWKVMSQHIFPSLTVAMLTFFLLGSGSTWLSAQSGYCDNPLSPLEVTVSPDVSICLGSDVELTAEAEGGIFSLPRSFAIRLNPGNNLFVKEYLDGSSHVQIDMGTTISYAAGDFGNGDLYSVNIDNNSLVIIDTTTADATTVGSMVPSESGHIWAGLAYDETTDIMYALSTDTICSDSSIVYQVNLATGQATEAYRLGLSCGLWLGVDPVGDGYVLNAVDSSLYSFDLVTGDLTHIGNIGTQVNFCQGADFDPVSGILYAALYNHHTNETTFSILDTETAELTPLSTVPGEYCVVALKNKGLEGYQYNWSPAASLDDPTISNPVASPEMNTTYTVTVTDACGNSATESVQVTVETPFPLDTTISCNMNVQVSVDQNCEAVVTADMILAGHYPCADEFHMVNVDGRGSAVVGKDDIGETLMVQVTRLDANGNPTGNSCWGSILVEDKLPPIIECVNDTLYCYEAIEPTAPIAYDNCGEVESIVLLDETITPILCDEEFIRVITREYIAIDSSDNVSQPCTQQILLKRINLADVEFPTSYTLAGNNALECDQPFPTLPNGAPAPEFSGYPTIHGMDILPNIGQYCSVVATFEDNVLPEINCKQKIQRVWTVRESWCNEHIISSEIQTIEIVDLEGPVIDCPDDITVSTSPSHSCTADVFIPEPFAEDACNEVDRIDLQYPGGFESNWTGGNIALSGGENILTFTAYDDCAPNSSSCTTTVFVEDNTQPIAVCKQTTVVSLTNDGTARVDAEAFDNGSFDECELSHFEVSRMDIGCDGELPSFKPYIDFFCCDLADNNIMIVLRVFDSSGNSNECMVEVEVQDKIPPAITCPPNIEVSCQFPFDTDELDIFGTVVILDNLSDLQDPNLDPRGDIVIDDLGSPEVQPQFWGVDGYAYDNCDVSVEESAVIQMDDCGIGTIVRTFSAVGMDGAVGGQCQQTISIDNYTPFTEDQITWPQSVTVNNGCNNQDLGPDQTGYPELDQGICDMVHYSYSDQVFNINSPNDPVCFKIVRTWTVIDWCQFENGQYITWVQDQTIKVVNDVAPVFTGDCEDIEICSYDPNCGDAYVELVQSAEDDCTPEEDLNWRYDIDLDNNGIFDLSSDDNPYADNQADPTDASGTYPLGTHRIVWSVEDGCGNISTCSQLFALINCTQPKAFCRNGIAIELMPMDKSGDGVIDTAMIGLQAHMLDAGSHHSCGYEVEFSFSEDPTDKILPLGCDDLGDDFVAMYVTDENGNQDFCIAMITVQDNNGACPPAGGSSGSDPNGLISGSVKMEDGKAVNDVEVSLFGSGLSAEMTDEGGNYNFPAMPLGGAYEVIPERDIDYREGITTYDIALIQRHILGIQYFSSPYQWIAADIDRTGTIDVRDIAELRRLILGTIDEFGQNTSWRFVDAEFQFDGFEPLSENFNETYKIPDFNANMTGLDFVAVKIGDINNSADPTGDAQSADPRSFADPLTLEIENASFEAGQRFEIPVRASEFKNVDAFQFTLLFNHNEMDLVAVESNGLELSGDNVSFADADRGLATFSWNDILPTTVNDGDVLFTLVFDARENGNLAGSLNMSSSETPIRAYLNGNPRSMEFSFTEPNASYAEFELFQNRPNPFTDHTVIGFRLGERADVIFTVMDVTGKVIFTKEDHFPAGYNEITIDELSGWTNQVYYYRLDTDGFSATRKMIMIR